MARSARAPADPGNQDRKSMMILGGVAAVLAVLVLGLGAWLQYGSTKVDRSVTVPIAPLKDEIEPPHLPAKPNTATPGPTSVPTPGAKAGAGVGAGAGAGAGTGPAQKPETAEPPKATTPATSDQPPAAPKPAAQAPAGQMPAGQTTPVGQAAPAGTNAAPTPAEPGKAAGNAPAGNAPASGNTPASGSAPAKESNPPAPSPAVPAPNQTSSNGTLVLKPPPLSLTGTSEHALNPAPDPGLIERGKYGFEPVIGRDGRTSWQVYARPFPLNDPRPRIAILVTGLGIGSTATDAAINKLPPDVSLAFAPFSRRISEWTNAARQAGHEVLLEVPMEPVDYPRQDPGYNALLTANSNDQNLDRLNWILSQTVGYVGVVGRMGGRFQAARESLTPVLADIAQRGLLFVDNRSAPESAAPSLAAADKLPYVTTSRVIDAQFDGTMIVRNLAELEDIARRDHTALGLVSAEPGAIDRVVNWAKGLQARGLVLAPVSALASVPPTPAKTEGSVDQTNASKQDTSTPAGTTGKAASAAGAPANAKPDGKTQPAPATARAKP